MKVRFVIFAALAFAAMNNPEHASGQKVVSAYHSERGRFSVSLPTTWEKEEQEMGHGVWGLVALSPADDSSDYFFENVNIVVVPADTTDLSQSNSRHIEVLKKNMAQFTLLDQRVGKIGQHSAAWILHTFSYESHTLKVVKYTLINGSEMYFVTCTALANTFDRFQPIFESIVASMAFDAPAAPRAKKVSSQSNADSLITVAGKLGALVGGIVGFYALFRAFRRRK